MSKLVSLLSQEKVMEEQFGPPKNVGSCSPGQRVGVCVAKDGTCYANDLLRVVIIGRPTVKVVTHPLAHASPWEPPLHFVLARDEAHQIYMVHASFTAYPIL